MSRRTRSVAVAVNAWNDTPGKSSRSRPSCRYSGRKSWPHWLMQCASSMAMNRTPPAAAGAGSAWLPSPTSRSGDTYSSRQRSVAHARDHLVALVRQQRAVQIRRRDAVDAQAVDLILHQRDERRDDQRRSAALGPRPAPAPGSRATCRRRSAARRRCRARRGWRASPRAAAGGSRRSPRRGGARRAAASYGRSAFVGVVCARRSRRRGAGTRPRARRRCRAAS